LAADGTLALIDGAGPLSISRVAVLAVPVAIVYWTINTSVLAAALSLLRGADLLKNFGVLARSETPMLGFSVLGALCGFVSLRHGLAVGAVLIVALLVLVEVLIMTSRPGDSKSDRIGQVLRRSLLRLAVLVLGSLLAEALGAVAAGAVLVGVAAASFVVPLVRIHHVAGVWDRHLAAGLALVEAPLISAFALAGVLAVAAEIWVAVATLTVILAVGSLASTRLRRRRNRTSDDDQLVAFAAEQAVLEGRSLPSTSSR
jgi:hypothetical protein